MLAPEKRQGDSLADVSGRSDSIFPSRLNLASLLDIYIGMACVISAIPLNAVKRPLSSGNPPRVHSYLDGGDTGTRGSYIDSIGTLNAPTDFRTNR